MPTTKSQPICKKSTNYLPILNSYPKIAPHPSQLSSCIIRPSANKRGADTSHHGQAKRLPSGLKCLTAKASAMPEVSVQKAVVPNDDLSCCELTLTTPVKEPSAGTSTDQGESSQNTSHTEGEPVQQQNKNRRFQNTLDILRRSGLLNIAMKTKELARLNQATQVQLERLQEQVALYSKAICSNSPEDWQMVQDALAGTHVILREIDM